jgi:hypothetical protein
MNVLVPLDVDTNLAAAPNSPFHNLPTSCCRRPALAMPIPCIAEMQDLVRPQRYAKNSYGFSTVVDTRRLDTRPS